MSRFWDALDKQQSLLMETNNAYARPISVSIDCIGPGPTVRYDLNSAAQVIDVMLCTTERAFRAKEQIVHDEAHIDI